jgi:hypothetical protein
VAGWQATPTGTPRRRAPPTTSRLINDVDTRDDTVLPAPPAPFGSDEHGGQDNPDDPVDSGDALRGGPGGRPRFHRLRWALVITAALLFVAFVASMFVPLPYYLIEPGSVRATEPLVSVEGAAPSTRGGRCDLLHHRVDLARSGPHGLLGWLDPDTDVVDEEVVLGDNSAEENRQVNLR